MIDTNTLATIITALAGQQQAAPATTGATVASTMIGKYAIIRSRNEGINAGTIIAADHTGVIIKNARRIWYHKPADKSQSWYEGVAISGLSSDSKISGSVAQKAIIEDYSVTICTDVAQKSIEAAHAHAQS
jgi:hypothetical protein